MPPRPEPTAFPEGPPVQERVAALEVLSPQGIDARLSDLGYRGQPEARRAAAVLAYRHLRRIRRVYLEGIQPEPGTRENALFLGPTGSGKTFLVELMFREVLGVPTVLADATQFSETGYVGDDVSTLLSRLYEAADRDAEWAACGVICMDEFDKLATSRSDSRFSGQQTTKDVSGFGVQRSLLHLLSAPSATFPPDFGFTSRIRAESLDLGCLTFIACGAFSGFRGTAEHMTHVERVGFGREPGKGGSRDAESIATRITEEHLENTTAFSRYGFIPELIGRFNRLVSFAPLDAATLGDILQHNVLRTWEREFEHEGLQLRVEADVRDWIVARAIKRETGARGLRTALAPILEAAAYEHFGHGRAATVRLLLKDDAVHAVRD